MSIRRPCVTFLLFASVIGHAQNSPHEKTFSAPVSKVQVALKKVPLENGSAQWYVAAMWDQEESVAMATRSECDMKPPG